MIKRFMYNSVGPSVIKKCTRKGVMPFDPRGVLLSCIKGMILWHLEKQCDIFNILFCICMLEDGSGQNLGPGPWATLWATLY